MNNRKVSQAVRAFEQVEQAQKRWQERFDALSDEEEAELEKRLLVQGVTFSRKEVTKNGC